MQFCPNIAMLFAEVPFLERFEAAADAGFSSVELWWPGESEIEAVLGRVEATGIDVVRFALDAGDLDSGDQGLLCCPDRVERFRSGAEQGIDFARELGCTMVNALAGRCDPTMTREAQLDHGRDQMRWLADLAAPHGITVLMEANTDKAKPGYLITTTREALDLIDAVDRDNVGLVFDTFHAQRGEGDLTTTVREHVARIAHVQLGDAPDRHEPGTGEIRFAYVIEQLCSVGYDGYLGLEYRPSTTTLESLAWLPQDLRSVRFGPDDLARLAW